MCVRRMSLKDLLLRFAMNFDFVFNHFVRVIKEYSLALVDVFLQAPVALTVQPMI